MKRLTFVEIDLDYCALQFGVGACPAVISGDVRDKCFNTKATCPVRPSFDKEIVTLRFAVGTAYLTESGIDYVASCIENISFNPATVSLGENLGTRATLSVTMSDFPFADTGKGFDKYVQERSYDPFHTGTFWGKFRARHPYLRGRAIRLIRGELGQTLEQMETRHFIMESFQSPTLDGRFVIEGKDALKMADGDRAKAPVASRGFLIADIDIDATTATLGPAGIGDIEYPASGVIAIAGKEVCNFTRVGDVLTLVRGVEGTFPSDHKAQDRVQLCIKYDGADAADIIRDLFVNYAGVPADYIFLDNWKNETQLYLRRMYSRVIAEATNVDKLISELIEQAALSVWWDDAARTIRLRVLRRIETDAAIFDDSNILHGSLKVAEQPQRRLSQVSTYFGKRTPLERDDETSYHSMQLDVNLEAEDDYGGQSIKVIKSSWIPQFGRPVAQRLNEIQLGRFVDPPRRFTFSTFLDRDSLAPALGSGYRLFARPMQTPTGLQENIPVQITRLQPTETGYDITADEMRFIDLSDEDLDSRIIVIDSNTLNFNWRASYNQLYPPPKPEDEVICIIAEGVMVGSRSPVLPAFEIGNWPADISLDLRIHGRIQGAGGKGGDGQSSVRPTAHGQAGGTAIYARHPVVITTSHQIWGGGGGGGAGIGKKYSSGGGGGGQGFIAGVGGDSNIGQLGKGGTTETYGGATAQSGRGGAAGQAGVAGRYGGAGGNAVATQGGAAGRAIDGNSFLTFTNGQGDIRGPRVG